MVYHARQEERYLVDEGYQPLYDAGRNATLMRIYWNEDGTPRYLPARHEREKAAGRAGA